MASHRLILLLLVFALISATSTFAQGGRRRRPGGRRRVRCGDVRCLRGEFCNAETQCAEPKRVGKGTQCDGVGTVCTNRLVCDGPSGDKYCKKVLRKGEDCTDDRNYVCKSRFRCLENEGSNKKTCKRRRGTYKPCGDTKFACRTHLKCLNNYCAREVPVGRMCDNLGRICEEGKLCEGEEGDKTCKNVLAVGIDGCDDANSICEGNLVCKGNKCLTEVSLGGSCTDEFVVCAGDLKCDGTAAEEICKDVLTVGNTGCEETNKICADDLICKNDKCFTEVEKGGSCGGTNEVCKGDLVCDPADGDTRTCKNVLAAGGMGCETQAGINICGADLVCKEDKCSTEVEQGDPCGGMNEVCKGDLVCHPPDGDARTCKILLDRGGENCSSDSQNFACQNGLECLDDTCVERVGEGHVCDVAENILCAPESICFENADDTKTCVKDLTKIAAGWTCLNVRVVFNSNREATLDGGKGIYKFTYDPDARSAKGTYGFTENGFTTCEQGGPLPSFNYGNITLVFDENYALTATLKTCDDCEKSGACTVGSP